MSVRTLVMTLPLLTLFAIDCLNAASVRYLRDSLELSRTVSHMVSRRDLRRLAMTCLYLPDTHYRLRKTHKALLHLFVAYCALDCDTDVYLPADFEATTA